MALDVRPLTPETWDDLVELFSRPGASIPRGCWCMFYRQSGRGGDGDGNRSHANRSALRALVDSGAVPGLVGYEDGSPVGWISLSPREEYAKLRRSPVMKPVDDRPVWSIVCFVVGRRDRGQGIAVALLDAAIAYARANGAQTLEAYPADTGGARIANPNAYKGTLSMFERAGFNVVARRRTSKVTADRPIVRLQL
jgi:ribosomal protein S18 acetylase RimI-like enzyme